jgi:hypothetical protein
MTEYVIKEIGPHQWLVFADRQSIALCADENEAVKVMTEHSTHRQSGNPVDVVQSRNRRRPCAVVQGASPCGPVAG